MGRRSQPHRWCHDPIFLIVTRPQRCAARKIRHLVALVPELGQPVDGVRDHGGHHLFCRGLKSTGPQIFFHLRAGLEGQGVARKVLDSVAGGLLQILFPKLQALTRQTVNEIQAQIVESGPAGPRDGVDRLLHTVHPAEKCQVYFLKRLNADVQAIETHGSVGNELVGRYAAGIDFQGDFRIGQKIEFASHGRQNPLQGGHRQRGRRAPADVNGVDGRHRDRFQVHFNQQCFHKIRLQGKIGDGEKIAVGAFFPTERNVNVQAGRLR